ncbi:recombinase family protein [Streptomyces sp. G2]|uniref:recombinase family protein n=1 Tax=Streptomyces sp. G2 TaxID=1684471 RepID=UPI00202E579F|nr:recombinase family protein [Streptomyces sp. G2]MCM1945460.1 recombinase family protein [Streptomyces sp. G2]
MAPTTLNRHVADEAADDRPRAVLYARQSKLNEDGSDASPLMQWEAGEALCAARGYRVVKRFRDVGKSGWDPSVQRDGFDEMMDWVRGGKCDVVVIFTLSRLTRMGAQEAFAIEKVMRDNGVSLVSVREPYLDTSDPIGAGIFAIIAGLAKQESDTKSAFIVNTKELARKSGGHVSGNAPWWGENVKNIAENGVKYISIRPTDGGRSTVLLMRDMAANEGLTPGQIAERLTANPETPPPGWRTEAGKNRVDARRKRGNYKQHPEPRWTPQAVLRTLRDPRIAGMAADRITSDKWEIRRDENNQPMHVHEPIITPAEWYILQTAISTEGKMRRQYHGGTYLLTGWPIMFSYCGATMSTTITKGVPRYRSNREVSAARQMGVTRPSVRVDHTDDYVARKVWGRLLNIDPANDEDMVLMAAASERFAKQQDTAGVAIECNELEAQIKHTEQSLTEIYADQRAGLYKGAVGRAAFAEAVGSMQRTEEVCRTRLKELRALQVQTVRLPMGEWQAGAHGEDPIGKGSLWESWNTVQRREFLNFWIDHIEVGPATTGKLKDIGDRLTIHWAQIEPESDEEDDDQNAAAETDKVLTLT